MKIKSVKIQNFRSIKEETLVFPDNWLISIIWPNNAWKSNFLRAIDLVLWDWYANEGKLEEYDFYCWNRENEIYIQVNFTKNEYNIEYFCFRKEWLNYKPKMKFIWNSNEYYLSNEKKDKFPCTYLSAERSISKDTSFTKWSLMWKISKSFNKSISEEQKEELKNHFDWVKQIFNWVENFSNFESDFKQYFEEMQSDSPYKLNIDFKPFTPNNYFKSINILATDPNVENNIDIEELWDGAKNLTIISLLRSYAKNFRDENWILAIEEPEIYLHPQARKHLFEILKDLSTTTWIQVIYTTHDPNFLEIWEFESIRRISKIDDEENPWRKYSKINSLTFLELGEFVKNTWWPSSYTVDWINNFYKSVSNHRLSEGFFSNLIILCEWPTEELIIPKYFEKNWFKYNSKWISILYTTWKWEIPKYWRLFNQFWIPVICMFDNDNSKKKEKNNQIICDCFNKSIEDFTTWLNSDFYKEIEIDNWKLVILEQDIENVIKKDFLKTSSESDYEDIVNSVNWTSKSIKALNIVTEILENYGNIPKFIKSLQSIEVEDRIITEEEISIEDIPF